MTDSSEYVPPKVWTWNKASGGLNRPIAGATHDKDLPVAVIHSSSIRWRRQTARK